MENCATTSKYQNLAGVYVLQCLIANDISPFDRRGVGDQDLDKADFYKGLAQLLDVKAQDTYLPAAEAIGQLLSFLQNTDVDAFQVCKSSVDKKVSVSSNITTNKPVNELLA
jgi:hypothetical protein